VPTYQYACTACGQPLEAVQSFTDEPLTTCPSCSGALRKLFSSVGVVFKGSGFYRTDSRGDAKSASAPASTAPAQASPASTSSTPAATPSSTSSSGSATPAAA
jgi:putative FmdB family regulatory protein